MPLTPVGGKVIGGCTHTGEGFVVVIDGGGNQFMLMSPLEAQAFAAGLLKAAKVAARAAEVMQTP